MTIEELIVKLKKITTYWHTKDKKSPANDFDDGVNAAYDCAAFIIEGIVERFEKERAEYRAKVEAELREYVKKCCEEVEDDQPLSEGAQHLAEGMEDCFIGDTYSVKLDEEEDKE
jgi:hypothetical protein